MTTRDGHRLGKSYWGSYNTTPNISCSSKNSRTEILAKMTLLESHNRSVSRDFGENINGASVSAIMES